MNAPPTVVVHHDAADLADAVAARLITRIVDLQDEQETVSVALTGGRVGIATLRAVADSPAHAAIDWNRVDLWWGDERFLPPGDPERNETQAREALLDRVPVPAERVHPMGADDPDGAFAGDPEAAAAAYGAELDARLEDLGNDLDIVLLGVGPDGHVASLFPEHPALQDSRTAIAVHGAPKPPPTRISLSLPTIRDADEVWLVVAGEDKASAAAMALSGAGPVQIPAAGAQGTLATRWLLDRAAAAELPPGLDRVASP